MNFNKIILSLSFVVAFIFSNLLGMKASAPAVKTETEILQKLIKKEARTLHHDCKTDDFSAEEIEKTFSEAMNLCNKLKKNLSIYFKAWSTIARNPVFEDQMLRRIEEVRKNLLLYKLSKGEKGAAVTKDKLKNLIALMKLYEKIQQELADKSLVNKFEGYSKKFLGFVFWPITHIYKSYLIRVATEVSIFLAMCGFINGMYLSDNFITGFCQPFVTVFGGIIKFFWDPNSGISCEGKTGLDGATCKTIEVLFNGVDWISSWF